jgi:putative transposase
MPFDPEIHHRRSIRLRGYDYSQPGSYYVTLCTQGKEHLFGQVIEGEMHRNEWGDCVARCWKWLAQHYPYVVLDEWTLMPNHLHGIIVIADGGGASRSAPTKTGGVVDQGGSRTAPTGTARRARTGRIPCPTLGH